MTALVEGILQQLGNPGGYQILVVALLCSNYFPIVFHQLSVIFYTEVPPHNCRLPEGWPWHKQFSIPKVSVNGQSRYDQCRMFVDPNRAKIGTKPCVYGWEFHPEHREWTVVAEWGLVCEREYLVSLASMVYYGGVMFGGLVFGTLADKFGRKPIVLFTLYCQTIVSVGIYFVQNFILFVILRFFHGLLLQGLQCTTFCLVMEQMSWKHRTMAGMSCAVAASLAMLCLSSVAYSVQHWRYIQLAISLPSIITLVYVWLIPESVRWLLTTMKVDNAHTAAKMFTRFNKVGLSEQLNRDLESIAKQMSPNAVHMENYGIREILFQGPGLRLTSLVLCFCWFSTSTLYQGLSLMMPDLSGNKYGNLAIVSVAELAGYVVMYFMLVRFGRKKPLAFLLILSGAVCISAVVAENVEKKDGGESNSVLTALALIERTCGAACLACLFIYAAEIYPTVVRCFGIGICLFCLQIGCLVAPQILKLGQHTLKSVPWIIFGAIALLAGCLVLLLPETFPMSLPDTMEEAENFLAKKNGRTSKKKSGSVSGESSIAEDDGTAVAAEGRDADEVAGQHNGGLVPSSDGGTETGDQFDEEDDDELNRYGKVVRFYGLEAGCEEDDDDDPEDPCHEVKTSKKERIRMVRFSFENEEFRLPRSPSLRAPRFSVIKEEPDLEVAEEKEMVGTESGEGKEVSVPEPKVVAVAVTEGGKKKTKGKKKGKKGQKKNPGGPKPVPQVQVQVQARQISRFTVQRVAEDTTPNAPVVIDKEVPKAKVEEVGQRISRFIVQRVTEDSSLPMKNNNNNNNNNINNETGEVKVSKEETSSTLVVVEEQLASKVAKEESIEDARDGLRNESAATV